ncbi:MAG: hypothetical protein KatS3mg115_1152 [Candidatus Poribacteria bacterium]|nr:MAG: hypothetical protein KatS3mg115_1152 [Candidatus Poribacteria bacterium]
MSVLDRLPDRRLCLIVNPTAGKGSAKHRLARLQERLNAAGFLVDVWETKRRGHATELAQRAVEAGFPLVAVLGGDGTVREVASALVHTPTVLAILPFGSGNDLARSLHIPRTIPGASRLLWQRSKVVTIDVGIETEGAFYFTLHSALGFAADVSHHAAQFRVFQGSAAYFMGVFKALWKMRPIPLQIRLDEEVLRREALFAMVLNSPYCGGGQWMAPQANPHDGTLNLVLVDPVSRLELVKTFPRVYSGRHVEHPAFHLYQAREVVVEPEGSARRIVDGDEIPPGPIRARVLPGALRVLVPEDYSLSSLDPSDSEGPEMP